MRLDIVHSGHTLSTTHHNGQQYALAPRKGKYTLCLYNDSPHRRLAVVSVDGINVLKLDPNGKGATYDGPGYVLGPFETLDIPGWRRDANKVAAFRFKDEEGKSYAEQAGRGDKNLGVIGLAVFDEQPNLWTAMHTIYQSSPKPSPWYPTPSGFSCSIGSSLPQATLSHRSATKGIVRTAGGLTAPKTLGTGYGEEQAFHTRGTSFTRASTSPAEVYVLRYATQAQFEAWGIPLPGAGTPQACAFPGQQDAAACPAPAGWRG